MDYIHGNKKVGQIDYIHFNIYFEGKC